MRRKASLQRTLTDLRDLERETANPKMRSLIRRIIGRVKIDIRLIEEELDEAKMIGSRGPSFDGDYVGWLDDDFDDDDPRSGKFHFQPPTEEEVESLKASV